MSMQTFVALGDSLSEGYLENTGTLSNTPWPKLIQIPNTIILAKCGKRTDEVYKQQFKQALNLNPTVMSIMVGTNDILQNKFNAIEYEKQMCDMISTCQSLGITVLTSDIPLLFANSPFAFGGGANIEADSKTANAILTKLALEFNTIHFEFWKSLELCQPYFDAGAIHPNQAGYNAIGQTYMQLLKNRHEDH